jgi:hypothetical protein
MWTMDVSRALQNGSYRSLRACSPESPVPFLVHFWRRHKWKLIGLGLFILMDLLSLGSDGVFRGHL